MADPRATTANIASEIANFRTPKIEDITNSFLVIEDAGACEARPTSQASSLLMADGLVGDSTAIRQAQPSSFQNTRPTRLGACGPSAWEAVKLNTIGGKSPG